ncbi:substrate-binding periplasmic protein [Oceanospirillum sediminis]|uniref:Transporter substrate-binding domain-containing protein n=1 Tax=Oceanospirillum sediminis TaxID=2760088 RepID=A0A839IU44_9GAMM|nr:transporter substrate-binding domain-containing protein [Oceanospirillum sediminis]MBB1488468.1 transporter substrate-binding domain-containing protein [Oceanospirillum sediminis]
MKIIARVLLGYLFFIAHQTEAQDLYSRIRISTIEYPPLFQSAYLPDKGYGVASDLTIAAFQAVNVDVKFDYIPMIRSVNSVVTRRHPASLGSINWFIKDQKEHAVEAVNLFNISFKLFYKKARFPSGMSYQKLSELKPFSIGNVRGSSTTPVVNRAHLNIRWTSALEQNFRMLNADRIDFAIGGETAGWTLIQTLFPGEEGQFAVIDEAIHTVPIGLVFHKDEQGLIQKFRQGIHRIIKDGSYLRILARYYRKEQITSSLLTPNIIKNIQPDND